MSSESHTQMYKTLMNPTPPKKKPTSSMQANDEHIADTSKPSESDHAATPEKTPHFEIHPHCTCPLIMLLYLGPECVVPGSVICIRNVGFNLGDVK
jgi:hypothetical protein